MLSQLSRIATGALILLSTISVPLATAQEVPDNWPDWLKQAMAKESPGLDQQAVRLGDGYLSSRLRGKALGEAAEIEDGWYLTSDIGAGVPLECWIFRSTVDSAALVTNIANMSIGATEEANGPEQSRNVYFLDMGEVAGSPYIALEWLFTAGESPDTVVGLTKVRVAQKGDSTIACGHNAVGHRETFSGAFEELVSAAEIPSNGPGPDYEEIHVHRLGGQAVGISHSTFTMDAENDTAIHRAETMLFPVDSSTLSTSDSWTTAWSNPDGGLINQVVATVENGDVTVSLELSPNEAGDWSVSGQFQGKELNGEISGDVVPISEVGQMRAVTALFDDDERDSVTLKAWLPEADPLSFVDGTVSVGEGGAGAIELGPVRIDAEFDRSGSVRRGEMDIGGINVVIDRVWRRGELP